MCKSRWGLLGLFNLCICTCHARSFHHGEVIVFPASLSNVFLLSLLILLLSRHYCTLIISKESRFVISETLEKVSISTTVLWCRLVSFSFIFISLSPNIFGNVRLDEFVVVVVVSISLGLYILDWCTQFPRKEICYLEVEGNAMDLYQPYHKKLSNKVLG